MISPFSPRRLALCILLLALLAGTAEAIRRPDRRTMTMIRFREIDIVQNSGMLDSLTRRVLIGGPDLWRMDMFRDGLLIGGIIRNHGQEWLYDVSTRSTRRVPDSAAGYRLSLAPLGEAPELWNLVMGAEIEFFREHEATRLADELVDTFVCEVHQFDTLTSQVRMWYSARLNVPMQFWLKTEKNEFKIRYDTYRREIPFDSTKFGVPKREISPGDLRLPIVEEDELLVPLKPAEPR